MTYVTCKEVVPVRLYIPLVVEEIKLEPQKNEYNTRENVLVKAVVVNQTNEYGYSKLKLLIQHEKIANEYYEISTPLFLPGEKKEINVKSINMPTIPGKVTICVDT